MNTVWNYLVTLGNSYPTDETLILVRAHKNGVDYESKEYLIESAAWQILSAFHDRKGRNVPTEAGTYIWMAMDDDMVN